MRKRQLFPVTVSGRDQRLRLLQIVMLVVGYLAGIPASLALDPVVGATLWSPQPAVSELRPGLAVTYDYARRVHVDDIEVLSNPVIGKPLDNIAHRTVDGKVLTAKRAMMVAAHIRGLIRFEAPGTYTFRIESNDGVKARIGDQQIWVDPEIHSNRWSPPIPLVIDAPGWYELWINYYQKKGTSALQLVWTVPGSESETHVPPEVLAHLDSQVGQ
ncbi:MAG: PA14 domain-containing protein [Pseudomonadota bacterium]